MKHRINRHARIFADSMSGNIILQHSLSVVTARKDGFGYIAAWIPGAKRPRYAWKVTTDEEYETAMARIASTAEQFRRFDDAIEQATQDLRQSLHVDDIFYASWGYEQTNVDFYQVTAVRGCVVEIRPIRQDITETGFMCGTTMPVLDAFTGPPRKHRVVRNYITVGYKQYARKWDGTPCRCSWYG